MAEPKHLPPILRDRKRYIIFEIISEQPVEFGDFVSSLWNAMLSFLGEYGTAESKIWLIQNLYDSKSQRGIIKCGHDAVERVRGSLSVIQIVGETKCIVKVLGVAGTIKSAEDKYLVKNMG